MSQYVSCCVNCRKRKNRIAIGSMLAAGILGLCGLTAAVVDITDRPFFSWFDYGHIKTGLAHLQKIEFGLAGGRQDSDSRNHEMARDHNNQG